MLECDDVEPHLRILHTVAEAVSRTLDVEDVLRTALDALTHVTGHEISSVHLLSEDGQRLHLRGDRGLSDRLRDINRVLPIGDGVIGHVAATGVTMTFADIAASPALFAPAQAIVRADHIQGFVCVPINSRSGILGTLSLGRQTDVPFDEPEIAL